MSIAAIVPVKDFDRAKRRLAPVLSDAAREELVRAMLEDVLAALAAARRIEAVFVVGHDAALDGFGVPVIREAANRGYNEAVAVALADRRIGGLPAVALVPGDLPLATADEIDRLAAPIEAPGLRIVPARDGQGTNGLLMAPPGVIATRFGPGSFERHRAALERVEVLDAPGLAFDIDTPQDLNDLCRETGDGRTQAVLDRYGLRDEGRDDHDRVDRTG